MKSPEMSRILESCIRRQALEVWLLAGRVPLLRFADCVRELMTGKPLLSEDIIELVLDGAEKLRAFWRDHDFVRFDCPYRDVARFRVFLVRHGESAMATLTPIPRDTPELEYSDDDSGPAAAG